MTRFTRFVLASALSFVVGLSSAPSQARDIDLGKISADEVKAFCNDIRKAKYLESLGVYGCKWIRDSGSFALICDSNGCLYTTPARRLIIRRRNPLRDIARGKLN